MAVHIQPSQPVCAMLTPIDEDAPVTLGCSRTSYISCLAILRVDAPTEDAGQFVVGKQFLDAPLGDHSYARGPGSRRLGSWVRRIFRSATWYSLKPSV